MIRLMFRNVIVLFVLFSFSSIVRPSSKDNNICADHNYYADDNVGWCAPDGWTLWSSYTQDNLEDMLHTIYNVGRKDVYDFHLPLAAMQMHKAVNKYAVYVQVYVTDYDTTYANPDAYIKDLYISGSGNDIYFDQQTVNGSDIGVATQINSNDNYQREWVVYPFPDLGKTYFVVAFAGISAWQDSTIGDELNQILFSLYETSEPRVQEQTSGTGSTTQSTNHPVWYGGRILKVLNESGKGSIPKVFEGGTWEFFSDSTVMFTPTGIGTTVRDDLFPVKGQFSLSGANVNFSNGVYTISGGVASFTLEQDAQLASVLITGEIDFATGVLTARYLVQSSVVDNLNHVSALNKYQADFSQQLTQG